jgi:hypothetical protein
MRPIESGDYERKHEGMMETPQGIWPWVHEKPEN